MKTSILEMLKSDPEEIKRVFQPYHPPYIDTRHKNVEIAKTYTEIIKNFRYLLSRMSNEQFRTYQCTSYDKGDTFNGCVLFEFVCVMCCLTLSVKKYDYFIELQTDSDIQKVIGGFNYRRMLRFAYSGTMYENTQHDIEDSIIIETNMADHYNYFKQRIKDHSDNESLLMIEDAIVE